MHIEPGMLSAAKIMGANAAAISVLASHAPAFLRRPTEWAKSLLAAAFFSVLMEVWHQPVGPSELHFIGASAIYFIFGFRATMFGFGIGLLFQGLLFEPQDLVHLSVNSLSLMVRLAPTSPSAARSWKPASWTPCAGRRSCALTPSITAAWSPWSASG